ncbi:hypothetical protein QQ045_006925 [Rhodiola kirilowii]
MATHKLSLHTIFITLTALLSLTCFQETDVLAARSSVKTSFQNSNSQPSQIEKVHHQTADAKQTGEPRHGPVFRLLMKGPTTPSAPSLKGHSAPSFRRHLLLVTSQLPEA